MPRRLKVKVMLLKRGDKVWVAATASWKLVISSLLDDDVWAVTVAGRDVPMYYRNGLELVEVNPATARRVYGKGAFGS